MDGRQLSLILRSIIGRSENPTEDSGDKTRGPLHGRGDTEPAQREYHWWNRKRAKHVLFWAVLGVLLSGFAVTRLYNIHLIGVQGGDAMGYVTLAVNWSQDEYQLGGRFRPGAYFLYSLPVRIFGNPTVSVRTMNAVLDVFTFLLIIGATAHITRDRWWAILAGLLYAASPLALQFARGEFTQIPCAFFVTLSFVLLLIALARKRLVAQLLLLFLSGLSMGEAWSCHESVAPLGLAMVIAVLLYELKNRSTNSLRHVAGRTAMLSTVFTIAYLLPTLGFMCLLGFQEAVETTSAFLSRHEQGAMQYYLPGQNSLWDTLAVPFGVVKSFCLLVQPSMARHAFGGLLLLSLLGMVVTMSRRKERKDSIPLVCALACVFLFACSFAVSGGFAMCQLRILLNLYPLLVIFMLASLHMLGKGVFGNWYALQGYRGCVALAVVALFAALPNGLAKGRFAKLYEPNVYRWTYDALAERVDERHKVLVLPCVFYSADKAYRRNFYFKDNAIYLGDVPHEAGRSLADVVRSENIAYVVWHNSHYDARLFDPKWRRSRMDFHGLRLSGFDNYSVEKERQLLDRFLAEKGSQVVAEEHIGTIYVLDNDKPQHRVAGREGKLK